MFDLFDCWSSCYKKILLIDILFLIVCANLIVFIKILMINYFVNISLNDLKIVWISIYVCLID